MFNLIVVVVLAAVALATAITGGTVYLAALLPCIPVALVAADRMRRLVRSMVLLAPNNDWRPNHQRISAPSGVMVHTTAITGGSVDMPACTNSRLTAPTVRTLTEGEVINLVIDEAEDIIIGG